MHIVRLEPIPADMESSLILVAKANSGSQEREPTQGDSPGLSATP
jgi:hypothetical protein